MLALSEGVFAIILTLLVLEIHIPELAAGQSLAAAAREVRPSFIAFLISFVVVAIAWSGHRDLFARITLQESDEPGRPRSANLNDPGHSAVYARARTTHSTEANDSRE